MEEAPYLPHNVQGSDGTEWRAVLTSVLWKKCDYLVIFKSKFCVFYVYNIDYTMHCPVQCTCNMNNCCLYCPSINWIQVQPDRNLTSDRNYTQSRISLKTDGIAHVKNCDPLYCASPRANVNHVRGRGTRANVTYPPIDTKSSILTMYFTTIPSASLLAIGNALQDNWRYRSLR